MAAKKKKNTPAGKEKQANYYYRTLGFYDANFASNKKAKLFSNLTTSLIIIEKMLVHTEKILVVLLYWH